MSLNTTHLKLGALCLWSLLVCTLSNAQPQQPNIIVIFADDMGYGDMSGNGHPTIRTPNLDQMAAEGQKWTSFYAAAPVCTPSRAGLMTGRLPVRSGMTSNNRPVLFPYSKGGMPAQEETIAEALKKQGYATALVGKWHLGHLPPFLPTRHGFDSWFGTPYSNDMDRNLELTKGKDFWHKPKSEYWNVPLMQDERIIKRSPNQELLAIEYTKRAQSFIRKNKQNPFFLYLAYNMPHIPLFRSDAFKGKSTAGLYGDTIEELDWSVGEILKTLKEQGLAENTLVVFSSDNGPWLVYKELGGSAGLLRGGKRMTFEGGMREPGIFWWPGTIKPGIVHGLGSTLDILPTAVSLAGGKPEADQLDGYDLSAVLKQGAKSPREEMFYYRGERLFAARKGRYKAHFILPRASASEQPIKLDKPLLYDLNADPSERYDIAAENGAIIADIRAMIAAHQATIKTVENQLEKM